MSRVVQRSCRRLCSWLGYPVPSPYTQHQPANQNVLDSPYILIEYIDKSRGKMLSESWEEGSKDPNLRKTL
ncbi:hypothetical protein BDV59DRAFT_177038 [Aspergillus ambiguus]|uniref:uncharacterized protein n=1 Tax=Aspergillus ambiguus TaxID=176160 RepID=UPI003CCE0A80